MRESNLLTGLLVTFAGIAALMGLLGVLYSPVTLGVAVPFALAAGIIWYQVSGRFHARVARTATSGRPGDASPGARGDRGRDRRASANRRGRNATTGPRGPRFGDSRRFGGTRFREPRFGDPPPGGTFQDGRDTGSRADGSGPVGSDQRGPSRREARRLLDVGPDASQAELRRAFRERAKELHPDRGGDEAEFRRVSRAYERLRE